MNTRNEIGIVNYVVLFVVVASLSIVIAVVLMNTKISKKLKEEEGLVVINSPTEQLEKYLKASNETEIESSKVPQLYPKVDWSNIERVSKENKEQHVYISTIPHDQAGGFFNTPFYVSGNRWSSTLDEVEYQSQVDKFYDYYENIFSSLGVESSKPVVVEGYKIAPVMGDGPVGSVVGYLIKENGFLTEIVLSDFINIDKGQYFLEIFVSDPFRAGDLLEDQAE